MAVDEAKAITKHFGNTLRQRLVSAMQSGGPMNALEVCNIEAMPITSGISDSCECIETEYKLKQL